MFGGQVSGGTVVLRGEDVLGDRCLGGQVSGGTVVYGDRCPGGTFVPGESCLGGDLSGGIVWNLT